MAEDPSKVKMTCTQEKHKVLCKFEFPGDANEDYYDKKKIYTS